MGTLNYIFIRLISLAVAVPITHHDDCGYYSNRYCPTCHREYLEMHYKFYHTKLPYPYNDIVAVLELTLMLVVIWHFIIKSYFRVYHDIDLKFTDIFKFIIKIIIGIFKVIGKVVIYIVNLFRKK
jgi:hypothetical protein